MSFDASGTIGKTAVFSKWRGRNYVRRHVIPSNPKSALQIAMRASLRFMTQVWSSIPTTQKNEWSDLAAVNNVTLLNAAVADAQGRTRQGNGVRRSPEDAAGTTPSAPTDNSSFAGFQENNLLWTAGATAPEFAWMIWRSTSGSFTRSPSTLIRIVPAATTSFIDTGLTSGTEYFYEIAGVNNNGEMGTSSAEINLTPT